MYLSDNCKTSVTHSIFRENTASFRKSGLWNDATGGAIKAIDCTMNIIHSNFYKNKGGAIKFKGDEMVVVNITFWGNSMSTISSEAFSVDASVIAELRDCRVINNSAYLGISCPYCKRCQKICIIRSHVFMLECRQVSVSHIYYYLFSFHLGIIVEIQSLSVINKRSFKYLEIVFIYGNDCFASCIFF